MKVWSCIPKKFVTSKYFNIYWGLNNYSTTNCLVLPSDPYKLGRSEKIVTKFYLFFHLFSCNFLLWPVCERQLSVWQQWKSSNVSCLRKRRRNERQLPGKVSAQRKKRSERGSADTQILYLYFFKHYRLDFLLKWFPWIDETSLRLFLKMLKTKRYNVIWVSCTKTIRKVDF